MWSNEPYASIRLLNMLKFLPTAEIVKKWCILNGTNWDHQNTKLSIVKMVFGIGYKIVEATPYAIIVMSLGVWWWFWRGRAGREAHHWRDGDSRLAISLVCQDRSLLHDGPHRAGGLGPNFYSPIFSIIMFPIHFHFHPKLYSHFHSSNLFYISNGSQRSEISMFMFGNGLISSTDNLKHRVCQFIVLPGLY